jgi:Domain of unknown function (DUF4331)
MRILTHTFRGVAALALVFMTASCSNDSDKPSPDAPTEPPVETPPSTTPTFHQVEHLARPGINEALLITEAFNAGYNATAPSFAGVPAETLTAVANEAKTVLKALYLGGCLINGVAGLNPTNGVHPAGMTCHEVGTKIFMPDGITLTDASKAAAQAYADKVFGQFIPDVLRIDTDVTPSNYLNLCGGNGPLLCGGRFLNDDVIDITYNYLLNGAANYLNPGDGGALDKQFLALTSDGVTFSKDSAKNSDALSKPDPANQQQGHPDVSNAFPYSAPPF